MDTVVAILLLVLAGIYLGLWVNALIEAARAPIAPPLRAAWLLAIFFFQFFGLVAWYVAGPRPARRRAAL